MKSYDFNYHERLNYLADLIEQHFPNAWHTLSKEALNLYPVDSVELQKKYLGFDYFEKAVRITLNRMELNT